MLFRLFNEPLPPPVEKHAIRDFDGLYDITREYKNEGIDAGWLVYTGYTYSPDGEIIHTYRLV